MKNTFIKYKDNKIVNLKNVSNIYIDKDNSPRSKVIFNMNYSVKVFNDKFTPDYVYWDFDSDIELEEILSIINDNIDGWITPVEKGHRYVNPDCISSIFFDENKTRVIFNLNYNVTHPKDNNKLTGDFVFYDFSDLNKYKNFVSKIISNTIGG